MKNICLLMLLPVILSCGGNDNQKTATEGGSTVHGNANDTIVSSGEPVVLEGCYEMIQQRDTATMYLNIRGTAVTGQLVYHRFEKDANTGSIKGELRNNHIYADYIFQSEGQTSTREVVFKIQDTVLLEGRGPVEERGGKQIFLQSEQLQFDAAHPFVKVDCRKEGK